MPHLMRVGRVVADVDLQSARCTHPCGWEGVQILWRIHTPPYSLLLAENYKCVSLNRKRNHHQHNHHLKMRHLL